MILAILALVAGTVFAPAQERQERVANGIAAIANDSVITWQEVRQEAGDALDLYQRTYYNQPAELERRRLAAMTESLEHLIDRQLMLFDFKTLGIVIPEGHIDDMIRDRIKERYGDRVTLTKSLFAQGMTHESFRQRTRDDVITSIMRRRNVSEALLVSPAKIEHYYSTNLTEFQLSDQVRLRMIVINRPAAGSPDDALKLANDIKGRVDGGKPFGEEATAYSEGPYRKEGGLWGWVGEKKLLKGLTEIAFNLPTGQCSRVVCRAGAGENAYWIYQYNPAGKVTVARKYTEPHVFLEEKTFPNGADLEDLPALPSEFYLLFVDARESAHTRSLQEVREEIEKELLVQERSRLERKWIDRLRAKSFVRYYF